MNFEGVQVVQKHEYQDIYRLRTGVLLKVDKFKPGKYFNPYYSKDKFKKVQGLKHCYEAIETFTHYQEVIEKGTIIFESYIITPVNNPDEYIIELKLAGGAYTGNVDEIKLFTELVNEVIEWYKNGGI